MYQCFKTINRTIYCSSLPVRNHAEGAAWVNRAMAHFGIQADEIRGKPYLADSIPQGAIVFP